jgi:hypothetical protein
MQSWKKSFVEIQFEETEAMNNHPTAADVARIAREKNVSFAEAALLAAPQFADAGNTAAAKRASAVTRRHPSIEASAMLDPASVALNDRAERIQKERKCEFAEALKIAAGEIEAPADSGVRFAEDDLIRNALAEAIARRDSVDFGEALGMTVEYEPGLSAEQMRELFPQGKDPNSATGKAEIERLMRVWQCSRPTAEKLFSLGSR